MRARRKPGFFVSGVWWVTPARLEKRDWQGSANGICRVRRRLGLGLLAKSIDERSEAERGDSYARVRAMRVVSRCLDADRFSCIKPQLRYRKPLCKESVASASGHVGVLQSGAGEGCIAKARSVALALPPYEQARRDWRSAFLEVSAPHGHVRRCMHGISQVPCLPRQYTTQWRWNCRKPRPTGGNQLQLSHGRMRSKTYPP
ncbi:hypothetical protein FHY19_002615 [Xanthomonas arboricola]|nr:hypothetical protein [Xanthomonas sp. 4461]